MSDHPPKKIRVHIDATTVTTVSTTSNASFDKVTDAFSERIKKAAEKATPTEKK